MTQKKKRIENADAPSASRSAPVKAMPVKADPTRNVASAPVGRGSSFEAILRHVIRLAEAVSAEPKPDDPAQQLLSRGLVELEPDAALKLRTLMIAGRDGRGVTAVHVDTKPADADAASVASELGKNGALLADYLRRGHAMACATGFDLERNISAWPSSAPHTLDERAWLSFGVQLAKSQPDEWTCLGFVGSDAQQLTKLYLRLGEHAWWSFRSLLDRPSVALVDKEKRALASRRSKGVATASLTTMADRSCGTEGRALRRAVKAIRARVGNVGESA